MAYTQGQFFAFIYEKMLSNMEAHFVDVYGLGWKHNWIEKIQNPLWSDEAIVEEIKAFSLEDIYNTYSVVNYIDLIDVILIRHGGKFTGGSTYQITYKLLPGHEDYINKWYARFPNKWDTDVILPSILSNKYTDWLKLDSDVELEEYLTHNVPNTDMHETLKAFATVMSLQLYGMLNIANYSLMPIYIDNSSIEDMLQAFATDQDTVDPPALPVIHPKVDNLRKSSKDLNVYDIAWNTLWYKAIINTSMAKPPFDTAFPQDVERRVFLNAILNVCTEWKSIFSVRTDDNDFYPASNRDVIYATYTAPHKLEWAIHLFNDRFNSAILEPDVENTHRVIRFPNNVLQKAIITNISSESQKKLGHMRLRGFERTDTILSRHLIENNRVEFDLSSLSDTFLQDIPDIMACYIDDFVHFPMKIIENDKRRMVGQSLGPINFDLLVSENVSLFTEYTVINDNFPIKTVKFDKIINIIGDDNIALAIGDALYHIIEINGDEVTIIDKNNILSNSVIGSTVEAVTYWATSVPGTLVDNAWKDKKIEFTKAPNIPYWDGVEDTLVRFDNTANWLRDLLAIVQLSLHDVLNTFIYDGNVVINDVNIISEFDSDFGIATDADLEIPTLAARIIVEEPTELIPFVPSEPTIVEELIQLYIDGGFPWTIAYFDRVLDDGYPDSVESGSVDGGVP